MWLDGETRDVAELPARAPASSSPIKVSSAPPKTEFLIGYCQLPSHPSFVSENASYSRVRLTEISAYPFAPID